MNIDGRKAKLLDHTRGKRQAEEMQRFFKQEQGYKKVRIVPKTTVEYNSKGRRIFIKSYKVWGIKG